MIPEKQLAVLNDFFIPISKSILFPEIKLEFALYLSKGETYTPYINPGQILTVDKIKQIDADGIETLFILRSHSEFFKNYLNYNLGDVLNNKNLPIATRAHIYYSSTQLLAIEAINNCLPHNLPDEHYRQILKLAEMGTELLVEQGAFEDIANYVAYDNRGFNHSINVFIYNIALLRQYGFDMADLFKFGVGSLIHDIGSSTIPQNILCKAPPLSSVEKALLETHTSRGHAMCVNLLLSQEIKDCILLHHERLDGKGYPCGSIGSEIPVYVKSLSLADRYDRLVTGYSMDRAYTSFEALKLIKEEVGAAYDRDLYMALVLSLSTAK